MNSTKTSFSLNQEFDDLVKVTLVEKQILDNNNSNSSKENKNKNDMTDGSAKSSDFSPYNKLSVKKSDRKYTTTGIKSRGFLPNISYVGINKEDFCNENFIFDIYFLIPKNHPFSLNRKLNDQNKSIL